MSQPPALTALADRVDRYAGGSPLREVLLLSLPISATLAGQVVMGFVNLVMVGGLGTAATAAVTIPGLVALAVTTLLGGVSAAVGTFAARAVGEGNPREAGRYVWQGLYVSALTLPVCLALASVAGPAFAAVNSDADLAALQAGYFRIRVFGCVTAVGTMAVAGFFQGVQRPFTLLAPMLTSNLFNLTANYSLIYGHFGLPRMELEGAAVATVAGSVFQFLWLLTLLLSARNRREYGTGDIPAPDPVPIRGLATLGLPTTVEKFVEFTGWGAFLAIIGYRFGKAELAASTITLQWTSISFMPVVGMALSVGAIVSKYLGRGRADLAEQRVSAALGVAVAYMTAMGAVFLLAGRTLMGVFSDDPPVIDVGVRVLVCAAVFQWINPLMLIYSGALRGAGDTAGVAWVMLIHNHLMFVPAAAAVAWLLPEWGGVGPWAAGSAYVIAVSAAYFRRYRSGAWKTMTLGAVPTGSPTASREPGPTISA
jgi:MATE family multidrug resistance protein